MNKKVRIIHIGLSANYGGIESFVVNYFKMIDKSCFIFDFVDIYGDGLAYENEIKKMEGKIFTLPNYKKHPLEMRKKLIEILKNEKYDIIHIHMLSCANIIPIEAAYKIGQSRVIVHSHNSSIPSGIIRRIMHSHNVKAVRKMSVEKWACGKKAGQWMWGENFDTSNIIANAIDTEKFKCDITVRNDLRQECGFTDNNFVIGFVGRFCEQKNVLFLISIFEKICKINKAYRLLMIGDGQLREEFMQKAHEKNLEDFIYFAGFQNNTSCWYSAMDCFVLSSKFEGLPFVAIEAQAAGLKSFISDRVTKEVKVTDFVEYISIDNDGSEWAEKINKFFEEFGTGKRFKEEIDDKYNISMSCKNLERKYLELLEEK